MVSSITVVLQAPEASKELQLQLNTDVGPWIDESSRMQRQLHLVTVSEAELEGSVRLVEVCRDPSRCSSDQPSLLGLRNSD